MMANLQKKKKKDKQPKKKLITQFIKIKKSCPKIKEKTKQNNYYIHSPKKKGKEKKKKKATCPPTAQGQKKKKTEHGHFYPLSSLIFSLQFSLHFEKKMF